MTLYYGQKPRGARLDGPERALDGFIGLIILIVEVLVGALVLMSLDATATAALESGSVSVDSVAFGVGLAFVASGLAFLITTIVYLVRLATAKRSWSATLWGLILVSAACVVGYLIMLAGS